MTQLAIARIISALKNEGFYVHEMDVEDHIVNQVRKDDIFLTFHEYENRLEIDSDPMDVHYVKTIVYESLLSMHDTINKIKDIARPEQLKEGMKDLGMESESPCPGRPF